MDEARLQTARRRAKEGRQVFNSLLSELEHSTANLGKFKDGAEQWKQKTKETKVKIKRAKLAKQKIRTSNEKIHREKLKYLEKRETVVSQNTSIEILIANAQKEIATMTTHIDTRQAESKRVNAECKVERDATRALKELAAQMRAEISKVKHQRKYYRSQFDQANRIKSQAADKVEHVINRNECFFNSVHSDISAAKV